MKKYPEGSAEVPVRAGGDRGSGNHRSICSSSGSIVSSMITKHRVPPTDIGNGFCHEYAVRYLNTQGIWEKIGQRDDNDDLTKQGKKKIACFFLLKDLKKVCPTYCSAGK